MDEEMLMKEFNEWVASAIKPTRDLSRSDIFCLRAAWLEATRRADKRAREECAKICDEIWSAENTEHGRYVAEECSSAIRDTIKEKQ